MTPRKQNIAPPEEWRSIYEGFYEVSDMGRVRRAKPAAGSYVGKIISMQRTSSNKVSKGGYLRVHLSCGGKLTTQLVHKLVMAAFVGPRPKRKEVNHKDGNKTNNRLSNLEYITKKRHARHTMEMGMYHVGERHWKARLTEKDVLFIRERTDIKPRHIVKMFGITPSNVQSIRSRRIWKMI